VLLEAPALLQVHSGCYEIRLIEKSNFGAPETSAHICRRLREKLIPLRSSTGYFESSRDCSTAPRGTWCVFSHQWLLHNHKAFRLIIFVFVTVTRFATSYYGMNYINLYIYTYGQSGRRRYLSIIGGSPGHAH
jgi:hypothetical protein